VLLPEGRTIQVFVKSGVKIGLAGVVLLACCGPADGRDAVSPLSRPISHFAVGKTSVLNALLWLGHDERICFGIEFSGPELSREVRVEASQSTIGKVLHKILGSSDTYQISFSDGVLLIRKKSENPPAWLDHRLPEFALPRLELIRADNLLWMALERDLNPSQRGLAGDSPVTDPVDRVGPFQESRQTVRQLLIKILAGSRGAGYFPTTNGVRVSFPASVNRFWTFVAYSGQPVCGPDRAVHRYASRPWSKCSFHYAASP
jgi:hypothetical protein